MPDIPEEYLKSVKKHYLNHTDDLFSSGIVSVAIQLSNSTDKNIVASRIPDAFELIQIAKKTIMANKKRDLKISKP